jgi:hypothetical protein
VYVATIGEQQDRIEPRICRDHERRDESGDDRRGQQRCVEFAASNVGALHRHFGSGGASKRGVEVQGHPWGNTVQGLCFSPGDEAL